MFTAQQEELRAADPIKIVRTWVSSPHVFEDGDSKRRRVNPDYHQPIGQREDGSYCDVEGRPIARTNVPKYILDQGKPPKNTPPAPQRKMQLHEVVQEALEQNATADTPSTPKVLARRPRRSASA